MTEPTPGLAPVGQALATHQLMSEADIKLERPEPQTQPVEISLADSILNALKRARTPEPEETSGDGDDKRQKTGSTAQDASVATWDIGAMLENALGSIGDQLKVVTPLAPTTGLLAGAASEPGPSAMAPATSVVSAAPRAQTAPDSTLGAKPEQKKMKFFLSPTYIVRSMGLPLLGTLAVQVLLALSERSRTETVAAIRSSESEMGKAYKALSATFKQARKMFSDSSSMLHPDELEIKELGDMETIQMANLATICSSVFESDEASLVEAHEGFLRTFLPEYGPLTDDLTGLFLGFKTQGFLRECPEDVDELRMKEILEGFFPTDPEAALKQLHPDLPLSQTEKVFINASKTRREALASETRNTMKRKLLTIQYPWEGFMDDLNKYLQDNMEALLRYAESQGIEIPVDEEPVTEMQIDAAPDLDISALRAAMVSSYGTSTKGAVAAGSSDAASSLTDSLGLGKLIQDSLEKERPNDATGATNGLEARGLASLIAEKLGANVPGSPYQQHQPGAINNGATSSPYLSHPQQHQQYNHSPYGSAYQPTMPTAPPSSGHGLDLPPHQSSPTTVLYERARQAAVAKSSAHARREGLHSTRRPWTQEEERALMTGLDMVKGPHWSQILQLFGSNGTISDILKDRTQVQLKDKARNLKLFFLKTNSEMPYYLQCVTGELKTRAPSQAARKEAEEKARMTSEEEQARIQGIITLAGGLQNNKPASPAPSAPAYSPLTPSGSVHGGRNGSPTPAMAPSGPPRVALPAQSQPAQPIQPTNPANHANSAAQRESPMPAPIALAPALVPAPAPAPAAKVNVEAPNQSPNLNLASQTQPQSRPPQAQSYTYSQLQQAQPLPQPQVQTQFPHQVPQQIPQQSATQHRPQPQQQQQQQQRPQQPPSAPAVQPQTPQQQTLQPVMPAQPPSQSPPPAQVPLYVRPGQATPQAAAPVAPQAPAKVTPQHSVQQTAPQTQPPQASQPRNLQQQQPPESQTLKPPQEPHSHLSATQATPPQASPQVSPPQVASQMPPAHQDPPRKNHMETTPHQQHEHQQTDSGPDAVLLQTLKAAISGVPG